MRGLGMLPNQASRPDGVADARTGAPSSSGTQRISRLPSRPGGAVDSLVDASPNAPSRIPRPSLIQILARDLPDCRSRDDLRAWLQHFAHRLGFYGGRYVHLGHLLTGLRAAEGEGPVRWVSTAARDGSNDHGAQSLLADPSLAKARETFSPFTWSTARPEPDLTARQVAWLRVERSYGIGAGVAAPIQDYAAGPACFSLFGVDEAVAGQLVAGWSADLAFVGAQFHARAQAILPATEMLNAEAALSPREIECLRLAATGLTVSAVAEEIGVTHRTVEFHLGNAGRKLGAVNKIHAIAIAASKHLIRI